MEKKEFDYYYDNEPYKPSRREVENALSWDGEYGSPDWYFSVLERADEEMLDDIRKQLENEMR